MAVYSFKRYVWILIFVLAVQLQIFAQKDFKPETNVGIKLGSNFSFVMFDPSVSQNLLTGFVGGLTFKHVAQKSLGILVELNYSQLGWDESLESNYNYTRRLNYMTLPFLSHFIFGKKKFKFFINFGPSIAYLLSEQKTTNIDQQIIDSTYYGSGINSRFDAGMCGGLGISQKTGIGIFQLEGRYYFGFVDFFKENDKIPFSSSKNQNIEISLSYFLEFDKIFRKRN